MEQTRWVWSYLTTGHKMKLPGWHNVQLSHRATVLWCAPTPCGMLCLGAVLGQLLAMQHRPTVLMASKALMGVSVEKESKVAVMHAAGATLARLLKVGERAAGRGLGEVRGGGGPSHLGWWVGGVLGGLRWFMAGCTAWTAEKAWSCCTLHLHVPIPQQQQHHHPCNNIPLPSFHCSAQIHTPCPPHRVHTHAHLSSPFPSLTPPHLCCRRAPTRT